MHWSSVLLPEPLGPITATTSPRATESEMPLSTGLLPKLFHSRRMMTG